MWLPLPVGRAWMHASGLRQLATAMWRGEHCEQRLNVINISYFASIRTLRIGLFFFQLHLILVLLVLLDNLSLPTLLLHTHLCIMSFTLLMQLLFPSLVVLQQSLKYLLHHRSRAMGIWHSCGICTLCHLVTPSWLCWPKPDPSQVLCTPASTTDPTCDTTVLDLRPLYQEQTSLLTKQPTMSIIEWTFKEPPEKANHAFK